MIVSIAYLLGLSRIGFAYFPFSDMKWFTFTVMLIASIVLLYGFVHVVSQQLTLQTNDAGSESWLRDPREIVRQRYFELL